MIGAAALLSWLFGLLAAAGSAYALVAAREVLRRRELPGPPPTPLPAVTILKPLYGAEPSLADNLRSFCHQDYDADVQVICGIADAADPAAAVVRSLADEPVAPELVVDGTRHGANLKVGNLINMMARARHDLIVLADSDMSVPPDYLRQIAACLAQPGVGAVTCLYRGVALPRFWSRVTALAIDLHFLPSVLVGLRTGLAQPCFGSTIALTRATLERLGGFEAIANHLADDYALGEAVRRLGLTVAVPPMILGHTCSESTAGALFAHELRWSRTVRLVDPAGFAGTAVTHALPTALLAALFSGAGAASLALLAGALICRLALQRAVDHVLQVTPGRLLLVPVRDMISFAVFVASFFTARVSWRGARFEVKADGTLAPLGAPLDKAPLRETGP